LLDATVRDARTVLARRADGAGTAATATATEPARRVVTRAEALGLAHFVRDVTRSPYLGVVIDHTATAVATQRVGHPPHSTDADALTLSWETQLGSAVYVNVDTNVRDPDLLRQVILHATVTKTPPMTWGPLADDGDRSDPPKPATYLPVALWHQRTIAAMASERGEALAQLTAPFAGTAWHGMGTAACAARAFFFLSPGGDVDAWGESTDSEVSVTARAADGSAVGWSGRAHRDWGQLQLTEVAKTAIAEAERHRNPSRFEPGRYTAILSATAVGQLLQAMAGRYNIMQDSPFNLPRGSMANGGRSDRRGQRVFDPRITLSSDPADLDGGDLPFFYGDGGMGNPNPTSTWVEHGVLKLRSAAVNDALMAGLTPRKDPLAVRMSGGPTSVAEMIASCERGIYVHRFANLEVVDPRSGALSGFTRDGCLLIMHGKIARPIKDFRIFESPFLSFNRVLALGTPERVAFGFIPPNTNNPYFQWPLPPVIAPPMMVTDFNFAALSDAV